MKFDSDFSMFPALLSLVVVFPFISRLFPFKFISSISSFISSISSFISSISSFFIFSSLISVLVFLGSIKIFFLLSFKFKSPINLAPLDHVKTHNPVCFPFMNPPSYLYPSRDVKIPCSSCGSPFTKLP